ncbi:MAG: ribulose-phosphate 3-epimerase [Ktedonobacterales bacterium]|nr:ribulose-phosphate 3-epimerase [Ktedonobacterales bacterium]
MALIVPSILSADFTRLGEQVKAVADAGADRIQVDVMDGHFVPNISIGALGVEAVRRSTTLPIEAHLMITDPTRYVDDFLRAGANLIIFHSEVLDDPRALIGYLHQQGVKAGLAISPETDVARVEPFIDAADLILVMTVHPGFGGQEFMAECLPKVSRLRALLTERHLQTDIEVDGGIHAGTAAQAVAAGANVLVAGSSIYGHAQGAAAGLRELRAGIGG